MTIRITTWRALLAGAVLAGSVEAAFLTGSFLTTEAKASAHYLQRLEAQDTAYMLSLAEKDGAFRAERAAWAKEKAAIQQAGADQALALTERIVGLRAVLKARGVRMQPETASAREIELAGLLAKARK